MFYFLRHVSTYFSQQLTKKNYIYSYWQRDSSKRHIIKLQLKSRSINKGRGLHNIFNKKRGIFFPCGCSEQNSDAFTSLAVSKNCKKYFNYKILKYVSYLKGVQKEKKNIVMQTTFLIFQAKKMILHKDMRYHLKRGEG